MLRGLPDESVHCCVTSPPYLGIRHYGVGAASGEIGSESSMAEHLAILVDVFREVRRVLRRDGTCWVNYGDSYASGGNGGGGSFAKDHIRIAEQGTSKNEATRKGKRGVEGAIKRKDLMMLSNRLAIALQDDGWYVRQENVWFKTNAMPDSAADRPGCAHEKVWMLTRSAKYFYDAVAVRTPLRPKSLSFVNASRGAGKATADPLATNSRSANMAKDMPVRLMRGETRDTYGRHTLDENIPDGQRRDKQRGHSRRHVGFNERWVAMSKEEQQAAGANLRNVWPIATANFPDGHFAVMADEIAEICIKAGCPKGGTVLYPFLGAGTTAVVSDRLGMDCIGIELNHGYVEMARRRVTRDAPLLAEVSVG